jgi:hypothetical protein
LEESLAQLKEMFKERTSLIQMLTPGATSNHSNSEELQR